MLAHQNQAPENEKEELEKERYELLERLQDALEVPMIVLGLGWLVLLIVELTSKLSPLLELVSNVIWVIFVLDFLLKFVLAPQKLPFLKKNILTIISLALPALRVLRVARFVRLIRTVRAARSLRLVKVIGSLNRGIRSLGATMQRRAFGYVMALTFIVLLTGAAGMFAFERNEGQALTTYGKAVWWTAMVLITMGSEYWPKSPEGQILCLLLALYGFTVFGYFTALLATYFLGRDAEDKNTEIAGAGQIKELQHELRLLRQEIQSLRMSPPAQPGPVGQEQGN
jgi:voltage-gated potassium channel